MGSGQPMRATITPSAARELKHLPPHVQDDIRNRHLSAIQQNPYRAGKPLKGKLKGLRSYRFGHHPAYRIIYEIVDGREIRIVKIAKREDVYN